MRELNYNLFPTGTATVGTPLNSAAIPCLNIYYMTAQAVTGTGAGTLKLQVSNDDITIGANLPGAAPVNWTDLTGATVTVAASSNGIILQQNICYQWARFVFTPTTTGTINARAKALGA